MAAFVSSHGWSLVVWLIVFNVILMIVLMLRWYAAQLHKRSFRLDDAFIMLAYVSLLALQGATLWGIANGMGAHGYQLNPDQRTVQAKVVLSATWSWTIATVSCKLALLAFYNEVFTVGRFRVISYFWMAVCVLYAVVFIPVFMTQCKPIAASWNPTIGHCKPIQHEEYASVSINMALDLAIVALPLPTIWTLQMPWRKKLGISFMFSLGLLTVTIMAWRIQSTVEAAKGQDALYQLYFVTLQSHLEIWLGIIGASLPTLAPIASKLVVPTFSRFFHSCRELGVRISGQRKEVRTVSESNEDLPLQRTAFRRLQGESLAESGSAQHYSNPEAVSEEEPWSSNSQRSPPRDRPDAITIRKDCEIVITPRSEV